MKRLGYNTVVFTDEPVITGFGSVAGKKEAEGPLGKRFDKVFYDARAGKKTFEEAEILFQQEALAAALGRSGRRSDEIDYVFAGDLLNQCISSSYGMKEFGVSYLGQYGACSTMAQSLFLAALTVESGAALSSAAVTSSHFCTAERQYRMPLEYGGQRTTTAQWTVTGSGACVVEKSGRGARIAAATTGVITDLGITDMNNMGAAMAPAAADTILNYFRASRATPSDFDLILTGDLGAVGSECLYDILATEGLDIVGRHNDCGLMIYGGGQDVHAGGSGCGCSASVLCSTVLPDMLDGKYDNILFVATGALMSPVSSMQGKSIPSIAHLAHIKNGSA